MFMVAVRRSVVGFLAASVAAVSMAGCAVPEENTDVKSVKDKGGAKSKNGKGADKGGGQDGVLTVEVKSTGSANASITMMKPDNSMNMSQETAAKLPFKKSWSGVNSIPMGWNMNAQQSGGGAITCIVTHNGEVVNKNTSKGDYAVVTCSAG